MNCIHIVPPSDSQRRKRVYRNRANNLAAKKAHVTPFKTFSPIEHFRQVAMAECRKQLDGAVGECAANTHKALTDQLDSFAKRLVEKIEQVLE